MLFATSVQVEAPSPSSDESTHSIGGHHSEDEGAPRILGGRLSEDEERSRHVLRVSPEDRLQAATSVQKLKKNL